MKNPGLQVLNCKSGFLILKPKIGIHLKISLL